MRGVSAQDAETRPVFVLPGDAAKFPMKALSEQVKTVLMIKVQFQNQARYTFDVMPVCLQPVLISGFLFWFGSERQNGRTQVLGLASRVYFQTAFRVEVCNHSVQETAKALTMTGLAIRSCQVRAPQLKFAA